MRSNDKKDKEAKKDLPRFDIPKVESIQITVQNSLVTPQCPPPTYDQYDPGYCDNPYNP